MVRNSNSEHIEKIMVVSNTHWDREFRKSFEKTRRMLLDMLDITLDILLNDPDYHSFTMDGHSIMIEDYLEMRPERRPEVEKLIREGRLKIGPYYTLAEQFSISGEAIVRNLMFGRKMMEKYSAPKCTVAYTPSSWGQTGQLPQILREFGIDKMMFYRGISHHEADAEYIWEAPDGSAVYASRFAVYARYNWYYQVHRAVTQGTVFDKSYTWGKYDDAPFMIVDEFAGEDNSYTLQAPSAEWNGDKIRQSITDMVEREGRHFTTDTFLAMNGHDISVAFPAETQIMKRAQEVFSGVYEIEHTDLETFWEDVIPKLDLEKLAVLKGERRSYLKEGMWTFLFPGTISTRTYLKQRDFEASSMLAGVAEPLYALAKVCGAENKESYLERGWKYLLNNHTHDANGGCAPDAVCMDMEYRYRKVKDIAEIVAADAMQYIVKNMDGMDLSQEALQVVVFNSISHKRDALLRLKMELPREAFKQGFVMKERSTGKTVEFTVLNKEKSSTFVDSIWDVPCIMDTVQYEICVSMKDLPALGYTAYVVEPSHIIAETRGTLVTDVNVMENEHLRVNINANGTIDVLYKELDRLMKGLNYLTDQGECGDAWKHVAPATDEIISSNSVTANIALVADTPLYASYKVSYSMSVPRVGEGSYRRGRDYAEMPVTVYYTLHRDEKIVYVTMEIDNQIKDHWIRANFSMGNPGRYSYADTHFDIIKRNVAVPDSTGWAEPAYGMQPMQSFVYLPDPKEQSGLAIGTRGLFEYEVKEDRCGTIALTLLRGSRIRLAVSEEKQTELSDEGIQCLGRQRFEYCIIPSFGSIYTNDVSDLVEQYILPPRACVCGRGKGQLAPAMSFVETDDRIVRVSAVKEAEDKTGIVIRLYNPDEKERICNMRFGAGKIKKVWKCHMNEENTEETANATNNVRIKVPAKRIQTFKVEME